MIIRKANLKDVPTIVKLWKEFMKDHDKIVIKENPKLKPHLVKKKDAADIFRKMIQKNIRSKNGVVHIAEVDGKSAAYSLIFIKDNIPVYKLEKIGYMSDMFVRKEFRGLRISSKFKDEAIKWFKKKRINYISLKVYPENKHAHSIYKNWDFFDYQIDMRRKI